MIEYFRKEISLLDSESWVDQERIKIELNETWNLIYLSIFCILEIELSNLVIFC